MICPKKDYDITDDVYENYVVYNRLRHKWCYLSNQEATEILRFRQYESTVRLMSGTSLRLMANHNIHTESR